MILVFDYSTLWLPLGRSDSNCRISNKKIIETVKEKCRLLIISIYRPPNANAILFIDKLSEPMSIISGNGYDENILCGAI